MAKPASAQGTGVSNASASRITAAARNASLLAREKKFRASDDDALLEQNLTSIDNSEEGPTLSADTDNTTAMTNHEATPYHYVPLKMGGNGRTHEFTAASAALIEEIGGLPTLERITTYFYSNAFLDSTLDKFIRSHDDPHAERFSRWIHQKLTGSSVWDEERASRSPHPVAVANGHIIVVHDRSSAHVAAWHSSKRPQDEVGRHFKLDECRVWMRLHFWAMREVLGDTSPAFTDYYIRFIGHFVNVYEGTAPTFARDSARWSADTKNIQEYIDNGRTMKDVLGLTHGQALAQIPQEEADDNDWPYDM
jgi:hypothetical protein